MKFLAKDWYLIYQCIPQFQHREGTNKEVWSWVLKSWMMRGSAILLHKESFLFYYYGIQVQSWLVPFALKMFLSLLGLKGAERKAGHGWVKCFLVIRFGQAWMKGMICWGHTWELDLEKHMKVMLWFSALRMCFEPDMLKVPEQGNTIGECVLSERSFQGPDVPCLCWLNSRQLPGGTCGRMT